MTIEDIDKKKDMDIFIAKRNLAIEENKKSFTFYGREVLVDYAKYVIESYKNKFKKG